MTAGPTGDVDDLLRRFADLLASEYTVAELDLATAALVLSSGETEHRLYLPRPLVGDVLQHMEQHHDDPWGDVEPVEAVARLMCIHLDESLATRTPHESGWWSYDGSFFDPVPPWEAPHR